MNSFDPEKHEYSIGKVVIPSVSAVLAPLSDFSGVYPAIMANAISWGSNVHKTIELYLNAELDEENLDPHLKNVLEQFKAWDDIDGTFPRCCYDNWIIERPCFHPGLKYGGTPDIVCQGDFILDIKSRKTDPGKDILQLSAYEAFYGKPGSHRLIVLELYEDEYKEVDLSNHKLRKLAWPMYRTMLNRWHSENDFKQKLEGWKNKGR